MPNRTIAKFSTFVILAVASVVLGACGHTLSGGSGSTAIDGGESPFSPSGQVGTLESAFIKESSGLIVSKCQPNVFWTHNDSGDDAFIYAFADDGRHLGTWRVSGARNIDWEDMASTKDADGCRLYIGDIGSYGKKRGQGTVYRVKEPVTTPESIDYDKNNPLTTEAAEVLHFTYESKYDAETLAVNPKTGDIYVISKRKDGPAAVYKMQPLFGNQPVRAERVAELSVPGVPEGLITGGDISSDGTRIVLCDYVAGYELTLPAGSQNFDDIWKQKPVKFDIGRRAIGETVAYSPDGNSIYTTSEGRGAPIFEIKRR